MRQGRAPRPVRTPACPPVAAVCVYPDLVETAVHALRGTGVAGRLASPRPSRPAARRSTTKLHDVRDAVAAGATEIDMVIDRGAFLAGRYGQVFDEIVGDEGGLRRRPPQGHPRDRRAGHARQRAARVVAGAARRRRLHQDLDRQGQPGRHSPGRAGDAARRCATSHARTGELRGVKLAGGIRTTKEAVRYLVMVNEVAGDAVADAGPVPLRRVQPAQRPAAAAAQADHRRLRRPRLRDGGLMMPRPSSTPRRRSRATSRGCGRATRSSSTASSATAAATRSRRSTRPTRSRWPRSPRRGRGRRRRRRRRAPRLRRAVVDDVRRRARQVPVPHRPRDPGTRPRAGRARVARQRQADQGVARRRRPDRRGALLLLRGLGRQARLRRASAPPRARSAWPARSSRGTSRC